MPGFDDGAWFVQDVAASLPARLLGDVGRQARSRSVRRARRQDGAAGAGRRLGGRGRLHRRRGCHCSPRTSRGSVLRPSWSMPMRRAGNPANYSTRCCSTRPAPRPAPFAGIPTSPILKSPKDIVALAALQARLLDHAATLVKPGGRLVYSTCSLEPEEGEAQIAAFLRAERRFPPRRHRAGRAFRPNGMDRAVGLPADFSLPTQARNAGMERNGRLFCHTSGPLRLSVPRIGLDRKPPRPDNARAQDARGGLASEGGAWRQLGDNAAWRLTLSPTSAAGVGHAPRLSGPGRFAASCSRAWRASPIPAPRPSSFCSRRRSSEPPTRASPPNFTTAISDWPADWPRSTPSRRSRSRRRRPAGRASCTASAGSGICAPPAANCRASRPRRWCRISSRSSAPSIRSPGSRRSSAAG